MTYRIMKRLPRFTKKSLEYKLIKQAVITSKRLLPPYSSKFSKRKYKQYQLFVILLYKVWVNVSYRDVIEVISSNPVFVSLLSLSDIPHFTTIQKFCKRVSMKLITSVFNKVVKSFEGLLGNIIIIDSTGFSVNYHSFYYDKRLNDFGKRVRRKYVKTTIIVDEKSQMIVAFDVHFGEIHDSKEFKKVLENMDKELVSKFKIIIGDKGYDSEENHVITKRYNLLAIIPVRSKDVPIHRTKGEYRKRMKRHLSEEYKRRSIVETVHSVIKRKSVSIVRSRIPELTEKEIALKIIAYNIRRVILISNSKFIFVIIGFLQSLIERITYKEPLYSINVVYVSPRGTTHSKEHDEIMRQSGLDRHTASAYLIALKYLR